MSIDIARITPSEALQKVREPDSQLVRLITAGYNLTIQERQHPVKATEFEYDYPDDRATFFLAREGGEVVGSVGLILWPDSAGDKRGGRFWPKLKELNPPMAGRAGKLNPLACDIGGVVTLPRVRGKGLGTLLLKRAVEQVHPSVIVGNTKTVEAVALRRKLDTLGYRTFYGRTEVTPNHTASTTNDHAALLQAYYFAKEVETLPSEELFLYHGGIAPSIPKTEGFPDIIQEAFRPLINAQTKAGDSATVMAPLISVRKEVLETPELSSESFSSQK